MRRYLRDKLPDDPLAALAELARVLDGNDGKLRAVPRPRADAKKLKPRRIAQGMKGHAPNRRPG